MAIIEVMENELNFYRRCIVGGVGHIVRQHLPPAIPVEPTSENDVLALARMPFQSFRDIYEYNNFLSDKTALREHVSCDDIFESVERLNLLFNN